MTIHLTENVSKEISRFICEINRNPTIIYLGDRYVRSLEAEFGFFKSCTVQFMGLIVVKVFDENYCRAGL